MSLLLPGAPLENPGVERFAFSNLFAGSGSSPRTWTIQLPSYGAWLLYFWAFYGNSNNTIDAVAHISWFRYDVVTPSQQKNLGNTRQLGVSEPAAEPIPASGSANRWTALTISDPSSTGLVTVTGEFSAGDDLNPAMRAAGHKLIDENFF